MSTIITIAATDALETTSRTSINTNFATLNSEKAEVASPTFTGVVTIPTPFTLGAVSVTTTGTELNYVAGVTSAIQTQLNAKEGTLTNSAGLAAAISDETGTGVVVFNTSPTLVTPVLGVATATSLGITGTAGAGYIDLLAQSSAPASPSAGTGRLYTSEANGFTQLEYQSEALTNTVLGQDNVFIAKNTSGGAITKGQIVYVTGSVGDVPTVSLAKADSLTTLTATIGIATETSVANNGFGQFMWGGILTAVDTSAFATGNAVYVSAATAGAMTATKPVYPNFQKFIGVVLNSGVGNGSILVNVAPFNGGAELGTNASAFSLAGTLELGHATDTTLSRVSAGVIAVEGVTVPTISSTSTLTNKRVTERVVTAADDATAVIDVDVTDQYQLTAMANATTISTTGTPTAGQKLIIRLKDDGTGRALTWDAVFRAIGVTLPTTTVANKTHYIGCIYNLTDTKWDAVAVVAEA